MSPVMAAVISDAPALSFAAARVIVVVLVIGVFLEGFATLRAWRSGVRIDGGRTETLLTLVAQSGALVG